MKLHRVLSPAFITTISVIATAFLLSPPSINAQSTTGNSEFSAAIAFSGGGSIDIRGKKSLPSVEIGAGETATINLQLPASFANTTVVVQGLDGGGVANSASISADGTGSIAFQAGTQSGLYRVSISALGNSVMLRFWVPNNADPATNPPML